MKYLRLLTVLMVALLGMTTFAQDFPTTFTTTDGLSVGVPDGFESQEMMPGAVGVLDPVNEQGVIVFFGSALESFGLPTGLEASTIFAALAELGGFEGDPAPLELANGSGLVLAGDIPNFGPGTVVAVDAEFGLVVAFVISKEGTPSDEFVTLANTIIGSVSFDAANATVVAEPTALPTEEPAQESTAVPNEDGDATAVTCPIDVKDLPELTVQFCLGAQFEYPENWSLFDGTENVDTYASLGTAGFGVTLSVTLGEVNQYFNPTIYKTDVVSYMAESLGDAAYDPAKSWVTLLDEDGKLIEVYDSRETLKSAGSDLVQLAYLVTLNNDLFVSYTFNYIPNFSEEADVATIEGIVLSTQLTDFYTGTPASVESDGEQVFVTELECGATTYGFNYTEDGIETYIVKCPICEGTEGSVWGTDIYTDDSSVCLAAAHAGTLDLEIGGLLLVTMSEGLEAYTGSEANGVTSRVYGTWGASFSTAPFVAGGDKK